jgi:hypothetical protein
MDDDDDDDDDAPGIGIRKLQVQDKKFKKTQAAKASSSKTTKGSQAACGQKTVGLRHTVFYSVFPFDVKRHVSVNNSFLSGKVCVSKSCQCQ